MKSSNNVESIKIFSNVFDDNQCSEIIKYITGPGWEFGHSSKPNTKNLFWIMKFQDKFFTEELFSTVKQLAGFDCTLERVYANGQTFGLDGDFHIDSSSPKDYSFLYYAPIEWNVAWGGETVIQEPSGKLNYYHPLPNHAIMFPASWWHRGLSPVKEYTGLRVTLSFKLLGK